METPWLLLTWCLEPWRVGKKMENIFLIIILLFWISVSGFVVLRSKRIRFFFFLFFSEIIQKLLCNYVLFGCEWDSMVVASGEDSEGFLLFPFIKKKNIKIIMSCFQIDCAQIYVIYCLIHLFPNQIILKSF